MITPEQLAGASEDSQQKALFCWAALNIKKYPALEWLFHIPNGGSRDIREATKLKAMGVKPGVLDLFLAVPAAPYMRPHPMLPNDKQQSHFRMADHYHGLFIELKTESKTSKVSDDQKRWLTHLTDAGYCAKVCWSWTEAKDLLIWYCS